VLGGQQSELLQPALPRRQRLLQQHLSLVLSHFIINSRGIREVILSKSRVFQSIKQSIY